MGMNPESIPQVRGAEEPFLAELGAFFKRNTKSYGKTNYKEYPGIIYCRLEDTLPETTKEGTR